MLLVLSLPVYADTSRLDAVSNALDAFDRKLDKAFAAFDRADTNSKQNLGSRKIQTLDMGFETYMYKYWEDIPITNKGTMNGYFINYTYRPPEDNVLNNPILNAYLLEFRYASGSLDYEGSGTIDGKKNNNLELRMLFGKEYGLDVNANAMPYFGFGYRTLFDEGNGKLSSTNAYGYDRRSTYYYLPLGARFNVGMNHWKHTMGLEYDFLLEGIQISDLSAGFQWNAIPNPNVHNHQRKGYGARATYRLAYSTPKVDFFVEPFFRYWNIEASNVVNADIDGSNVDLVEPHNTTKEFGSKIGLQF